MAGICMARSLWKCLAALHWYPYRILYIILRISALNTLTILTSCLSILIAHDTTLNDSCWPVRLGSHGLWMSVLSIVGKPRGPQGNGLLSMLVCGIRDTSWVSWWVPRLLCPRTSINVWVSMATSCILSSKIGIFLRLLNLFGNQCEELLTAEALPPNLENWSTNMDVMTGSDQSWTIWVHIFNFN